MPWKNFMKLRLSRYIFITWFSILFATVACATVRAELPTITWHSDFVQGNESFLMIGEGFVAGKTEVRAVRLQDKATSEPAENIPEVALRAKTESLKILRITKQSLAAVLPLGWNKGVYVVWVGTGGEWSKPVYLNRAAPEWTLQSNAEDGAELRVVGRNLESAGARPRVQIHSAAGDTQDLTVTKAEKYDLHVQIPESLAPGKYEIRASNGYGGAYGWSEPLSVNVVRRVAWPQKLFNVRSFGALGDGQADDSVAVLKAIKAAGDNGGGIVYFSRGIYCLTAMLRMPERVVLKGEGREKVWLTWPERKPNDTEPSETIPAVIVGERNFGVEDLSLSFQASRHGIIAPFDEKLGNQVNVNPFYMNGTYNSIPDERFAAAGGVFIRNCIIRHLRFAPRLTLGDWRLQATIGQPDGTTIALGGSNIVLENNDVASWGRSLVMFSVHNTIIAGNTIGNGRNGWYCLTGATETIFENNTIMGDDLESAGGSINRDFPAKRDLYHLYVAHNRYRRIFGGEREAVGFDNTSPGLRRWLGRVVSSTADATTLADANWAERGMEGLQCLIVNGRGIGQFRTIEWNGKNEIRVDTPWTVTPDATSVVDVLLLPRDIIAYANDFEDSSVGVQLYGATYNFVVDGNTSNRGGGFYGYATYYKTGPRYPERIQKHLAPMYFPQFIDNKVIDGYVYEQGPTTGNIDIGGMIGLAANPWKPDDMSITLGYGIVVQRNHLYNDSRIVLRTGFQAPAEPTEPLIRDSLIEDNQVESVDEGIEIGPGTQNIVLRKNSFHDVGRQVLDHGLNTLDVDANVSSAAGGK